MKFSEAESLYAKDEINTLAGSVGGRRFLILRSLSRTAPLEKLAQNAGVDVTATGKSNLLKAVYDSGVSIGDVEAFVRSAFLEERKTRTAEEPKLISELYKMQEFNWGGLHQNSLDKTIVNNYVKKVRDFDRLNYHIENELLNSMRGYARCSWYNHWTSIIIEDIFKEHPAVLPAIGLVKKIDFFIHDVPFDLKVTYLPEGYIKDKRKAASLKPELTVLKKFARDNGIPFEKESPASEVLAHLWTMIADSPAGDAKALAVELRDFRQNLIDELVTNPNDLIVWLYENQGERRFDAANRLFLVLVNHANFFESWKLKRNRAVMADAVTKYLDKSNSSVGRAIDFVWEKNVHSTRADVIVVDHRSV